MSVKLKLLVRDTKIQTKHALDEVHKLAKRGCVGYIGAWTSGLTMEVSKLLSIPSIDRAMIAYSAESPELNDPSFSNILRTKPSFEVAANMFAKLMKSQLVGCLVAWLVGWLAGWLVGWSVGLLVR